MPSVQLGQAPAARRGSRAVRAFALTTVLIVTACGGGRPAASLDGTYAGSFSGTLRLDALDLMGVVEFRISGGAVSGVFITGLGRQIGFGAAKEGIADRSLRVVTHPSSGCSEVSGTHSEIDEAAGPPGVMFVGRLPRRHRSPGPTR